MADEPKCQKDPVNELREAIREAGDQFRGQTAFMQKMEEFLAMQKKIYQAQFPYYDGVFHEDRAYSQTIEEMKQRLLIAENDKKPEAGYVFSVNVSFYGAGGKLISGAMQLDGGLWDFDNLSTMHERGITEPLPVGWYISSYNTSRNIYGVAFRAVVPLNYNTQFRILLNNNNARTTAQTNAVVYNLQTTRFIRNKIGKEAK